MSRDHRFCEVGTAALLLLFIGIHNAWDAVVYHMFVNKRDKQAPLRSLKQSRSLKATYPVIKGDD